MAKRKRTVPDDSVLDEMFSTHVSFEINRFKLGHELWGQERGSTSDLLHEACLIHMRLLLDFFYPRGDAEDTSPYGDIFASDYISRDPRRWPSSLKALLIPPPWWLLIWRDKLDWQLAHLTTKRIDLQTEHPWAHWEANEPFKHMEKLIDEFLEALPPERRCLYDPKRGWPGSQSSPMTY